MKNYLPLFTSLVFGFSFCISANAAPEIKETTVKASTEAASMEYTQPAGYKSTFPWHAPMGKGIGAMPGRVVWAYAPESVHWDLGYWWEPKNFEPAVVRNMVDNSIASLGGADTTKEGWDKLFKANNEARGKGAVGYKPGEKIAIKVNMNGAGWYQVNDGHTRKSFSNPVAVRELVMSLVEQGGVKPEDITIFDVSRNIPGFMLRHVSATPLEKVNFKFSDEGGSNDTTPDRNAPIVWSKQFKGEQGYFPTCLTEAEYLINFATLKGHSMNGVSLTPKNHFGSFHTTSRGAPPVRAGLHKFVQADGMGQYSPLVDLMSNKQTGPKTVLYLLEGLITAPSEGASMAIDIDNSMWKQEPFKGKYPASILFSQDPVAIDSVGMDFLMNEPTVQAANPRLRRNRNVEGYIHEAANVANPPSGTTYLNGAGEKVTNLGVHEHWNNAKDKLYSRNLGKSEGIELVRTDGQKRQ